VSENALLGISDDRHLSASSYTPPIRFSPRVAESNPAQIDGATRTRRASQSVVPDVDELTRIADLIEPARFKALILNSAWCCLRYDEVTELRPQGYWRRCRSHWWLEEIV